MPHLNRRTVLSLIGGTVLAAPFVKRARAEGSLAVYNWADYIGETTIEDFQSATGISVTYDNYASAEEMQAKMLAGSTGYDVVDHAGLSLPNFLKANLYEKLDKSKLPNLANMWPDISARLAKYDPGNEYAVNYMWGTTGIGYNAAKIKEALGADFKVDSWDAIFKPENAEKLKACGINILDASDETFAISMNYIGKDPDSKAAADLEAGGAVYSQIRPFVKTFNSSSYIDDLANGDICVTIGWSGDILQAKARAEEAKNGVEIEYVIPKEGTYMWFDNLAIPADSKNVAEAHEFINYLMKPEVIAKASNYVQYANGNLASQALLDEAVIKNPSVYPTEETVKKLFTISPYGPKEQRVLNRVWTQIKTGS